MTSLLYVGEVAVCWQVAEYITGSAPYNIAVMVKSGTHQSPWTPPVTDCKPLIHVQPSEHGVIAGSGFHSAVYRLCQQPINKLATASTAHSAHGLTKAA